MPELCEVVLTAQYLSTKIINKYITNLKILKGKYTHKELIGKDLLSKKTKILNIDTKGKFMWFTLQNEETNKTFYMMNWFGLTGEWSFKTGASDRIVLDIENDDGKIYKLYYSDQRNFGILQFADLITLNKKINTLAPDYLKSNFTVNQFYDWFKQFLDKYPNKSDMKIVELLLEQDKDKGIGSGVGNYLSAEILYRAKISPYRLLKDMSVNDIKTLGETTARVVKMCYMTNITGYMKKMADFVEIHKEKVESGYFPDYHPDIPINSLEDFEFLVYQQKKDKFGNEVQADNIAVGRTTYWVKEVQK